MEVLRELIPWDGYALSAWDIGTGTHRHITLASEGYPTDLQDHMNDAFVEQNPGFRVLHTRVPHALRWLDLARDWEIQFARTSSAEEHLIPAGFTEGATMCLRLPDGRYTGALHVSWKKSAHATDEARRIIEGFRPVLARACDLLSDVQHGVQDLGPEAHVALVSAEGSITDMPGRSMGPILSDPEVLRDLIREPTYRARRFLWASTEGLCHRIELVPWRGRTTMLVEQRISWPFGLTSREAEILRLVADGMSNPQIGKELFISPRTVSTHVEHILHKLNCQSRAQLARFAVDADLLLMGSALGRAHSTSAR
ncbi:regulatory protein, luxR family [Micromonospora inyonensis]|uniref:Regulatory protein, luxR family n=2 Tax=Micromonospora inyonensis TaxID=47866 RepID=A0A1C6S6P5_9ACTN|nr:regulatory protein, luxR family [Micromonospora inyonensis]